MTGFDLSKTAVLHELLAQPAEARDGTWVQRLEADAPDASMVAGDPQVQSGPDGFPYFRLQIPPVGAAFEAYSVTHVLPVCTESGYGCVLEGVGDAPPWVFTYGDLWSLRATGGFGTPRSERRPPGADVLVATPSEELVPAWARVVLRSWLAHVGVHDPGCTLVVDAAGDDGPVDWLAFTVFPDQFPDEAAYRDVLNRLHWFLPRRFAVLGVQRGVFDYTPL